MNNRRGTSENSKGMSNANRKKQAKSKARIPKATETLTVTTKKVIQRVLGKAGFEIRKKASSKSHKEVIISSARNDMDQSLKHILNLGYRPELIVDVGVATGTNRLQENFSKSRFLWVEPLVEFEPILEKLSKKYNGEYILAAAGSFNGHTEIQVDPDLYGSSLMFDMSEGHQRRQIRVIKLDDLVEEYNLKSDILLKVDVQGYELEVLEGAQKLLQDCEIVILEVAFIGNVKGMPEFYDVVDYMKKRNYVVYDIMGGINRPYDNALFQQDLLFVKENGRFRVSNKFATKEQLERWYESSKYCVL